MIWRVLVMVACAAATASASPQSPDPTPPTASSVTFLPRSAFHLTAEHLSSSDDRFVWDANFGGTLDLVDYGAGRATFLANYEAVLGEQLRPFDPNQGNYVLGASMSIRAARVELAGVFHHESRHLSDRRKVIPVDWNMFGGRLLAEGAYGRARVQGRADLRRVVRRSTVDYTWELDTDVAAQWRLQPRIAAISEGRFQLLGVDGSRSRGTQTGVRGEGGMRFEGPAGAVELFVAAERRIDPYPLEFSTATWVIAGFRLLSR